MSKDKGPEGAMYSEYRRQRQAMANSGKLPPLQPEDAAPQEGDPGVPTLVDADWLKENVAGQGVDLRVVDASWHMPMTKRDAAEEYKDKHIPGAVFFDLNEVKDKSAKNGDQILPSAEQFSEYVGALGITRDTHVILYDNNDKIGMFSAPRAWYIFRVYGHTKLSILNGGLPQWLEKGGEVTSEVPGISKAQYQGALRKGLVRYYYDVVSNLTDKTFVYVDGRPAPRFNGTGPEPRPDIKPGHIPEAVNLPFTQFMNMETKTFRTAEEVEELFKTAAIDLRQPLVFSCGTGLTACFLLVGAYLLGYRDLPLYDGAWTEWFQRADVEDMVNVPIEPEAEEQNTNP